MKIKNIIVPFTIVVVIITLRISSTINNELYYDNMKTLFKKEIDVISIAKSFFGNLNTYIFEEDSFYTSSTEEIIKISENDYYIKSTNNKLQSKNSGICVSILKKDSGYEIVIKNDNVTITYLEIQTCEINLYDYIKAEEQIGTLKSINENYYYKVKYEN